MRMAERPTRRPLGLVLAVASCIATSAAAQPLPPDSLPAYRRPVDTMRVHLGELVVDAASAAAPGGVGAVRVGAAALAAIPATSLADVVPLVAGAFVQTNSRGETLLYLRGAGERQTLLLLDGAPLAVPWDRRIDLALVPALALGEVEALAGPAAITAGPDALGGAVRFQTRRLAQDGQFAESEAWGRWPAAGHVGAVGLGHAGPFGWTAAAQLAQSGGEAVAGGADLPFSQPSGQIRTNTDRASASALARLGWSAAAWQAALTVLGAADRAGVAPESHLDPDVDPVRFWRLPDRRYGLAVLNARHAAASLTVTAWAGGFGQTIAQYPDGRYQAPEAEQRDRDAWTGLRLRAKRVTSLGRFGLTGRGQLALHREREQAAGQPPGPDPLYRHLDLGLLADWSHAFGATDARFGVRYDRLALLDTGDKPRGEGFGAASGFASLSRAVGRGWSVHLAAGRAARFPTLRELYGVALDRFADNPGLRAERAWTAELGAQRGAETWSGRVVGFGRRTTDAIEQEILPDGRRRRVNLGGTDALGVEASGAWRPAGAVRIDGHLTVQHLREQGGGRIPEKPEWIARLAAAWAPPMGARAGVEGQWTGGAVGAGPDGALLALAAAPRVGLQIGYRLSLAGTLAEAFVRVDNGFDAVYEPQRGLPAAGRSVGAGVRLLLAR